MRTVVARLSHTCCASGRASHRPRNVKTRWRLPNICGETIRLLSRSSSYTPNGDVPPKRFSFLLLALYVLALASKLALNREFV
eukprot:scaffold212549_cov16-Prasinocladus_malaysianus.AAC.1